MLLSSKKVPGATHFEILKRDLKSRTEFSKFGDALAKTKKKLQEASKTIIKAEVRTRAIERKLRKVQEIPQTDTVELLEGSELQVSPEVTTKSKN